MTIDDKLQKLILKYNIDSCVPKYNPFLKACTIAKKFYEKISNHYRQIVLFGTNETDVKWVQKCICKQSAKEFIFYPNQENRFDNNIESFYWVVSRDSENVLLNWLKSHKLIGENIYDLFQENGIQIENNFYDIYDEIYYDFRTGEASKDWKSFDINRIFFSHRRNYEMEQNLELRKTYLEQIIFDCVFAKDFLTLKEYIDIYVREFGEELGKQYIIFYGEVCNLLEQIKERLMEREQKDVIMIWLDALEYGEDKIMPFLSSVDENSIVFDNAYTVTPYTGATFKTLFAKQRVIEEKSFNTTKVGLENSQLLRDLFDRNYKFKYYGELDLASKEVAAEYFYTIYTPMTQVYWDIVCDMVDDSDSKAHFSVLHEVLQTHVPYISLGLRNNKYFGNEEWPGQQDDNDKALRNQQVIPSRLYVDRQLQFWNELLPSDMYKIYMSDHGHTLFGRFHTILKIQQEDLIPQRCKQLFSYYDFDQLILRIIDFGSVANLGSRSFVFVEDVDYYNKDYILETIGKSDFYERGLLGYRGVITQDDMLIRYRNGMTYYLKKINDEKMVTDERLKYLSSLLDTKFVDINKEEKFKYSRLIWNGYVKCLKRSDGERRKKEKIIRECVDSIPEGCRLAIRGGGIHTLQILMLLDEVQRKKIMYIIDRDKCCVAGKYGIKVITPDQLDEVDLDKIIISSYEHRTAWKNELKCFQNEEVIDIYDVFEKQGLICTKEFYKLNYITTDFMIEEDR